MLPAAVGATVPGDEVGTSVLFELDGASVVVGVGTRVGRMGGRIGGDGALVVGPGETGASVLGAPVGS